MCVRETHECGRIRTAAALSQKTAQKQPGGLFLAARLAISTRAHQEIQHPNRVLDLLFCRNFFRAERVDSNSIGPPYSPAGKKAPSGAFLDARLVISTLAHQEIQYPNRVLDFLFCGNFFRAGGKRANVKTKVRFLPRPAGCVKLEEKIAHMRCILGGNRL